MILHSSRPARLAGGASSALLLAGALAGCEETRGAGGPPGFGGPPPQVDVMVVQPKSLPVSFEYTGQTHGSREVEVRARVTGILLTRNYTEGSCRACRASRCSPSTRRRSRPRSRAPRPTWRRRGSPANAAAPVARVKPLPRQAVSKRDYDDAMSAEQVAAADLKSADARVTEARSTSATRGSWHRFPGVAGGAAQSEGSLVSGPDVLLTTIVQIDPIKAVFGIPDAEHARIQADIRQGACYCPQDGFGVEVAACRRRYLAKGGTLQFSEPLVNSSTGTCARRPSCPTPTRAIKPGQFVRVLLVGATRPDVVQVPQRAVLEGPQGKFVYVVAQRQARDEGRHRGQRGRSRPASGWTCRARRAG